MTHETPPFDPPAIWIRDWGTGLPSRSWFLDHCRRLLHLRKSPITLILCDLDLFYVVNSAFGLTVGDEILAAVADDLRTLTTERGALARFGGDSFAFVAAGADAAEEWLERFRSTVRRSVRREEHELALTASFGVVRHEQPPESVSQLLRGAEIALFEAKQTGDCAVVFDPQRHGAHLARIDLASDLSEGIRHEELMLYHQPIYDLESRRLYGFESLLRWNHPRLGILAPERFLSVIETPSSAWEVDRFVVSTACGLLHRWSQDGRWDAVPPLSVNLSSAGVANPRLVDWVERCLSDLDVDPHLLHVEVTERVVLHEPAGSNLAKLRERGIEVLLDDFGTGFSALDRLSELPVDALKIDRRFISRSSERGLSQPGVVAAVATLGQDLGLKVIAEGIETRPQLLASQLLGCRYGQGYYLAHPLPQSEAEELMAQAPRTALPLSTDPEPSCHEPCRPVDA